jgi:hypothetical protein
MIANALSDTRVELLAGSAIVDTSDPTAGTSVTLIYRGWKLRQSQKGVFRLDCDPPRLLVREGQVEVSTTRDAPRLSVAQGMELPLTEVLAPEKATSEAVDTLSDWANGRAESIFADNAIAANIQDPASLPASDLLMDHLTYFPMLGISSYGSSRSGYGLSGSYQPGLYGFANPFQPGFYSIYLPGYSHPPLPLGLRGIGLQHGHVPPSRGIVAPTPAPRSPAAPLSPAHPGPRGGVRIGGRR